MAREESDGGFFLFLPGGILVLVGFGMTYLLNGIFRF
jgi:hypothetical protein